MRVTTRQLHEIASWRIMTEIIRHCPPEYQLIEMHPNGGQSDSLAIIAPNGYTNNIVASYNRYGAIALFSPNGECADAKLLTRINKNIFEYDSVELVERALKALNIPKKRNLPPSTPRILVYRFISTFLAHSAFGKNYWECRNGMLDTSGYGAGPVETYFDVFPKTVKRRQNQKEEFVGGYPEYRFWFILKDNLPVACLEETGAIWSADGKQWDLIKLYSKGHSMWQVVLSTLSQNMD